MQDNKLPYDTATAGNTDFPLPPNSNPDPSSGGIPPIARQNDSGVMLPVPNQGLPVQLPEEAKEVDLIEKEWIEKVREIIEHTKSKPFEQQKQLSKVKADYLLKRYKKDITPTEVEK